MIGHTDSANLANAPQGHQSFTILRRLLGPGVVQLAFRPRDRTKILLHQPKRFGLLELARDHEHDIIGLVILPVERPQVFDRHTLDVAAVADGGFSVVVPLVGGGLDPLHEHALRRILTPLEFIAHDRHFRIEIFASDKTVHEPIGFHTDGKLQVFITRSERLIVIDPIIGSAAVPLGAVFVQRLGDVPVRACAFEHHVLEQVGHARFAVAFVTRPNQHSHVHGDFGL